MGVAGGGSKCYYCLEGRLWADLRREKAGFSGRLRDGPRVRLFVIAGAWERVNGEAVTKDRKVDFFAINRRGRPSLPVKKNA